MEVRKVTSAGRVVKFLSLVINELFQIPISSFGCHLDSGIIAQLFRNYVSKWICVKK
jgi:hypothetical protein